ncbi:cadmium-translocating P-type ATPase (plasmid) [Rhizobium leguminosarum bv. viciae]|uniref:heavy metal translocating P-type ATPase n=1 Tax=Rhizobium leguminosarum TaxID=384 RepID=UPI000B8CEAEA|nr:heavy metal translocating P-type ATPase [Rhizobium leguminosarum]ASR09923.1 cadmium-translocating P-type ATPase [Rhizobium leguminosarum bv. viciae]NKN00612.1 cadmium-translocating P-type ATPase [Rhizobium leguminosarum bv. viciae]
MATAAAWWAGRWTWPQGGMPRLRAAGSRSGLLVLSSLLALVAALLFYLADHGLGYRSILVGCTSLILLSLCIEIARKLRKEEYGLDLIAALAMGSSLWFGEYLAGAIVGLMYSGGQFLEAYAHRRADEGMSTLLAQVPRTALRLAGTGFEEIPIETVAAGDVLLIRKGDVVPADGALVGEVATIDQAVLTGEPFPVRIAKGGNISSGATNEGDAIEIRVLSRAEDSTYAGIVRLVEASRRSKAKLMRLADRFSVWFLFATVAIAGVSAFMSGDMSRIVAVLVVATPCPLILAVPVALAAGTSKAAKEGVLVKGAGPLEALAQATVAVFDKTGTLTAGQPEVGVIEGLEDPDRILRLAASLDQASGHVVGRALVDEAHRRGLVLSRPSEVTETAGSGISGIVDGVRVSVGGDTYFREAPPSGPNGSGSAMRVKVLFDGRPAGTITLEDRLREDAIRLVAQLRALGISRVVLASGDELAIATAIARSLGLDDVAARLAPADKVAVVEKERVHGKVLMVGDGVNDAPALAAADVGIAVGVENLAAAAEAADIVLVRDDLTKIATAIGIARRSRKIALQSIYAGIGLSLLAMGFAGAGYLPPVGGALLQEAIDVAVILNALRAL